MKLTRRKFAHYGESNQEVDLNKIAKGIPCTITSEAKNALLVEINYHGLFSNHFGIDLGLTLESAYRRRHGIEDQIPPNMPCMSKACMEWAGLTRQDPYLNFKQNHPEWSVLYGSIHTFSSITKTPIGLDRLIELIKAMPEHGEEKEIQV